MGPVHVRERTTPPTTRASHHRPSNRRAHHRPVQTLGVEGGGTPAEVREFARLIEETRALLDRPLCAILVHHTNKSGDVAGAWGPVPDTTLHVSAQGNGKTRAFWQKARWASAVHGTSWHLLWRDGEGFELEDRPDVTEESITAELLAAVREHGGDSWTKIREHVRGNATEAAKVRDRLLAAGELVNTAAREGQFKLWVADDPAVDRSGLGTGLERLSFPPPVGSAEPDRSTVPTVSRNGERERNGATGADARLPALGDPGFALPLDRAYAKRPHHRRRADGTARARRAHRTRTTRAGCMTPDWRGISLAASASVVQPAPLARRAKEAHNWSTDGIRLRPLGGKQSDVGLTSGDGPLEASSHGGPPAASDIRGRSPFRAIAHPCSASQRSVQPTARAVTGDRLSCGVDSVSSPEARISPCFGSGRL